MANVQVMIHNKLAQKVSISLQSGLVLTEVDLAPHGTHVANADELTEYTGRLAAKGYIRIRPVA